MVPGPLEGPLAGSGRPAKSRKPLGPIVAGTRSSRNKSAKYLEDPDSECEIEDGFASDDDLAGASPEITVRESVKHDLTILYVCETGTVYTINDDYQAVIAGNHLMRNKIKHHDERSLWLSE